MAQALSSPALTRVSQAGLALDGNADPAQQLCSAAQLATLLLVRHEIKSKAHKASRMVNS
jgi:hypothetical protein